MNYSFLPDAEAEYLQAIGFFEERRPGLGAALIKEFEDVMDLVVERPQAWKAVHPSGIRRIGLRQFPFSVCYRVLPIIPHRSPHSPTIGVRQVTGSAGLGRSRRPVQPRHQPSRFKTCPLFREN